VKSSNINNNDKNKGGEKVILLPSSFYIEDGKYVFTEEFHLKEVIVAEMVVVIVLIFLLTKKGIQLYL
jgi:hypothetical protein